MGKRIIKSISIAGLYQIGCVNRYIAVMCTICTIFVVSNVSYIILLKPALTYSDTYHWETTFAVIILK